MSRGKGRPTGRHQRSKRTEFDFVPDIFADNIRVIEADEEFLKGLQNENLVEQALQFLKDVGHIYHYLRSKRKDVFDREGIDFLVWVRLDRIHLFPFQVKSSEWYRQQHLEAHGDTVPYCVVVEHSDTFSSIADKILTELGLVKPIEDVLVAVIAEAFNK